MTFLNKDPSSRNGENTENTRIPSKLNDYKLVKTDETRICRGYIRRWHCYWTGRSAGGVGGCGWVEVRWGFFEMEKVGGGGVCLLNCEC